MKIAMVATAFALTLGGTLAEAAAVLPKPASLMGGNSQKVQMHHYISKPTKVTSPEWGLPTSSLKNVPVQIHPYVTSKFGF